MALYNVKSSADILLLDYLVIREVESLSMKKYEKVEFSFDFFSFYKIKT